MPDETTGQKLQRLRQAAGMSQPQLAKAADVPVGTLRNWEQDRRVPRLDTAVAVARALRVCVDDLVGKMIGTGDQGGTKAPPADKPARKRKGK